MTENIIDENKLFSSSITEIEGDDPIDLGGEGVGGNNPPPSENEPPAGEKPKTGEEPAEIIDEYWNELKLNFGEEYQIPEIVKTGLNEKGEKITAKEKLSLLQKTILDSTIFGATEEDDAFVRTYMSESAKENFDRKKFLESYFNSDNLLNLPPDKFLFQIYKEEYGVSENNPEGMSDEDIQAYIDKKDPIEKKAESIRIKKTISLNQEKANQQRIENNNKKFVDSIIKAEESNKQVVSNYIEVLKNSKTISGFELGEAVKQEFIKELPEFVQKKVYQREDGSLIAYSKAEQLLASITSDPEKELELVPILWLLSKDKIKGYNTMIKERAKAIAEGKLSNERRQYGGSQESVSDSINEDALFAND